MFNLLFACTNTPNFHGLPRVFSRIKQDNLDTFSFNLRIKLTRESWLGTLVPALESKCCQISEHFYIEAEQVHKGG